MEWTDLLLFVFTFLLTSILVRRWLLKSEDSGGKSPPVPMVGILPFVFGGLKDLPDFLLSTSIHIGPMFGVQFGQRLCLILNSREIMEEALAKQPGIFSGRESLYAERISNKNRKGIVGSNYTPSFKRHRQMTLSVLREFGFGAKGLMEERILSEYDHLSAFICCRKGELFDPMQMAMQASANIITSICLGQRHSYEDGLSELTKCVQMGIDNVCIELDIAPNVLIHLPYYKRKTKIADGCSHRLLQLINTEIDRIKADPASHCFVSSYLWAEGFDHDHEQLIFTMRDFLVAGTETTATSLLWLLVLMANNEDVQRRLQREIDEAVGPGRRPSLLDRQRLPGVEATILEGWRFRTPVPHAIPHLTLQDTTLRGCSVPQGTVVIANLHAAHMDPRIWKHPQKFLPDRFIEDGKIINADKVIVFSLGRRSCLGETMARQELFLIFTCLLQEFDVLRSSKEHPIDERPFGSLVSKPKPFQIRMIRRQV